MLRSWTATTLSKVQMEALSHGPLQRECGSKLHAWFGGWRNLPAAAFQLHTTDGKFTHGVCVDPVAAALRSRADLPDFFARACSVLQSKGRFTLLSLTLPESTSGSPALAQACTGVSSALMPGVDWPTEAQVQAAASAAGLQQCADADAELRADTLSHHCAATLRQWQQRLAAHWGQARMQGAFDAALRRCEILPTSWVVAMLPCTDHQLDQRHSRPVYIRACSHLNFAASMIAG